MLESKPVNLRLESRLLAPTLERNYSDNLSHALRTQLERYYATLERELRTVRLAENETLLLCDLHSRTDWDNRSMFLLWLGLEEGLDEGLAEKWGVDGIALLERLKTLTPAQSLAVVDALERWRDLKDKTDRRGSLERVGLIRASPRGSL